LLRYVDLLIPLLIGAAFMLKGKADTLKELEFFPKSLSLSADKKTLFLIVDVLNPTKNKLEIDSLFLNVNVGETKIGSVEKTIPFVIRATGRSTIKFPVKINPAGSGKLLALLIKGQKIIFTVKGVGSSMGLQFPVDAKIPFNA